MGSEETQKQLDAFRRAYLDTLLTLSGWRAAQDCEAHVAHWVLEGVASHADLLAAREVTLRAHKAYTAARIRYNRLSSLAAQRAGTLAGSRAGLRASAEAAQAARLWRAV